MLIFYILHVFGNNRKYFVVESPKVGRLINYRGSLPSNKSHDLAKVSLILMIQRYLAWIYVL